MPSRYIVHMAAQADFQLPEAYELLSKGFRRWCILNGEAGGADI